jgi:hypothetical protein
MKESRCAPGKHLWCAVQYEGEFGEFESWRPLTDDELRLIASDADAILRINPSGDISCHHCDEPLDPRRPPDLVRRQFTSPDKWEWLRGQLT